MYIKPYLIEKNDNGEFIVLTPVNPVQFEDNNTTMLVDNEPIEFNPFQKEWVFTRGILFYIGCKNNPSKEEEEKEIRKATKIKFSKHPNLDWRLYPTNTTTNITLGEFIDNMVSWYTKNTDKTLVRPLSSMSKYSDPKAFDSKHVQTVKSFNYYFAVGHPYFIKWGKHPKARTMGDHGVGSYCMCIRAGSGGLQFVYAISSFIGDYKTETAEVYVKDVYKYNMEFYDCFNHLQVLDMIDRVKANPDKYKGKSEYEWHEEIETEFIDFIHDDDEIDYEEIAYDYMHQPIGGDSDET